MPCQTTSADTPSLRPPRASRPTCSTLSSTLERCTCRGIARREPAGTATPAQRQNGELRWFRRIAGTPLSPRKGAFPSRVQAIAVRRRAWRLASDRDTSPSTHIRGPNRKSGEKNFSRADRPESLPGDNFTAHRRAFVRRTPFLLGPIPCRAGSCGAWRSLHVRQ